MSGGHLRKNKICENCGNHVDHRFCSHCGQENIETRQSFHYLFTHVIEDLTHYENGFWKVMRYLLFSPVTLTQAYLSGKRHQYIAPVRLFIFINFIAFLVFNAFVFNHSEENKNTKINPDTAHVKLKEETIVFDKSDFKVDKNDNWFDKTVSEKISKLIQSHSQAEIKELILHKISSTLPKWLFLFMPFFALGLWLIHDKKKWWYFEHGIFTLHFFSSVLLIIAITTFVTGILAKFNIKANSWIDLIEFLYIQWLFFKSFRVFYEQSRGKSLLKLLFFYIYNAIMWVLMAALGFVFILMTI